jgi:glycosyltransferase involved in cell wall biosynthesis
MGKLPMHQTGVSKIALVTGEFPPMQGGVGDFTRELARALAALNHDVHVLTSRQQKQVEPEEAEEPYTVHRLVSDWGWRCWRAIRRWVADHRPDVVNLQYQAAAYAMRPAIHLLPLWLRWLADRPPAVVTYHDLKVPYLFPKAGFLRWQAVLALARWADAAVVTNEQDRLTLTRSSSLRASVTLIPIGSNIAVRPPAGYDRMAWRARYGLGAGDLLLAYFGFLNVSKGGETLIRALHKLTVDPMGEVRPHLLMVGGQVGSSDSTNRAYLRRIEALIAQLGLDERVHWTGYTPPEKVSANLLAADVCVLPYRDGASFRRGSFMAALAHGCPIVSTFPQVSLPELCHGENVLLVPPDDPDALATGIARLAADPVLRQRLGEAAGGLARQFTWQHIAARTADLFARLWRPA